MQITEIFANSVAEAVLKRRSAVLGAFPNPVVVDCETIADHEFDIHDCKEGGTVKCHRDAEDRAATYINGTAEAPHELVFIKYDEFLKQFRLAPDQDWSKDLSRVDYIVVIPDTNAYFLLHEISIGNIKSKESKARNQFIGTIRFLMSIPLVKKYIEACEARLCFVSARGCDDIKPSPRGVAAGFVRPYRLVPNPCEFKIPSLNNLGFTFWKGNIINIA